MREEEGVGGQTERQRKGHIEGHAGDKGRRRMGKTNRKGEEETDRHREGDTEIAREGERHRRREGDARVRESGEQKRKDRQTHRLIHTGRGEGS